jgi:hypothetical protein
MARFLRSRATGIEDAQFLVGRTRKTNGSRRVLAAGPAALQLADPVVCHDPSNGTGEEPKTDASDVALAKSQN